MTPRQILAPRVAASVARAPRAAALALAAGLLSALLLPAPARADGAVPCPGGGFAVAGTGTDTDTDTDTVTRICTAAAAAERFLGACHLPRLRPVTFEVRAQIEGPADHCAGLYACGSDRILVIPPGGVGEVMPEDSAFAPLAPDVYYDSLVVHELAHALMDQAACERPRCDADREYVAYALQIASLPPRDRAAVAAYRAFDGPVDRALLNDLLLWLKPDIFALAAWAHFDAPGHGCAFVERLVTGETTLALPIGEP